MPMQFLAFFSVLFIVSFELAYANTAGNGSLTCVECNVFFYGVGAPCEEPKTRSGCYACVKQTVWSYYKFTKKPPRKESIHVMRFCVEDPRHADRMGCDVMLGDSTYVEQCYCNAKDLCNGASRQGHQHLVSFKLIFPAIAFLYYKSISLL